MSDYYIKIKQNQSEIEFTTSDKAEFNKKLSELMRLADAIERNGINDLQQPQEVEKQAPKSDFEKILEKSIKHPIEQVSPNFSPDRNFAFWFKRSNPQEVAEKIIFTAGYLKNFENKEVFTIKDLNRKIFPLLKEAVSNANVREAEQNGLIKIIPNYADTLAAKEYTLTEEGEKIYNELSS